MPASAPSPTPPLPRSHPRLDTRLIRARAHQPDHALRTAKAAYRVCSPESDPLLTNQALSLPAFKQEGPKAASSAQAPRDFRPMALDLRRRGKSPNIRIASFAEDLRQQSRPFLKRRTPQTMPKLCNGSSHKKYGIAFGLSRSVERRMLTGKPIVRRDAPTVETGQ